jgi:serine/threonine protein kinase
MADFGTAKQMSSNFSPMKTSMATSFFSSSQITSDSKSNSSTPDCCNQENLFVDAHNFDQAQPEAESKGSFVGTEDFVAPEIIEGKESSYCADLWSLGVIIYQLLTGKSLFKGTSQYYTFENIQ